MDLLSNYDSSASETDDNDKSTTTNRTTPAVAVVGIAATSRAIDDDRRHNNASSSAAAGAVQPGGGQPQEETERRRGKKILSLAAVLPPHIYDQLTRVDVQRGEVDDHEEEDFNDDDDDDDSDVDGSPREAKSTNKKALDTRLGLEEEEAGRGINDMPHDHQHRSHVDPDLSAFLKELKSAPAKNTLRLAVAAMPSSSNEPQSRMGAALANSTVVVTVQRTNADDHIAVVRNIHGKTSDTRSSESIAIRTSAATPPPNDMGNEDNNNPDVVSAPAPLLSSLTAQERGVPSMLRVSAAPAVPFSSLALATDVTNRDVPQSTSKEESEHPFQRQRQPLAQSGDTASSSQAALSRKRSRKEMERALRHGNVSDVITGGGSYGSSASSDRLGIQLTSVEQARPDAYEPQPETYAVPEHGIRVAPTALYDPSSGQTSTNHATKGRGKNQIHHLLASAANLELQRARGMTGAGASGTASQAGKIHRANAKQKYGW